MLLFVLMGVLLFTGQTTAEKDLTITFSLFDVPEGFEPYKMKLPQQNITDRATTTQSLCKAIRQLTFEKTSSAARHISAEVYSSDKLCKLVSAEGEDIESVSDITDGMHLYVVLADRYFIWPTYELGHKVDISALLEDAEVTLETVSQEPRIFRLHQFLSTDELKALQEVSSDLTLERSTGGIRKKNATTQNGGEVTSSRTSTNAWDTNSAITQKIKRRTGRMLKMGKYDPAEFGGLQIVNYEVGQFYDFHQDWMANDITPDWNWDPKTGGTNRMATVFIYLSDTELGGSTGFPMSKSPPPPIDEEEEQAIWAAREELFEPDSMEWKAVDECVNKFNIRPRAGDAILFYHQDREGNLDVRALHGACPVLKGEKLGANLWIWNGPHYTHERARAVGKTGVTMECKFLNSYGTPVELFWVQHDDKKTGELTLISNGIIEDGAVFNSNTFTGHEFVAKNTGGVIIGRWEMKLFLKRIDITRPYIPKQHKTRDEL